MRVIFPLSLISLSFAKGSSDPQCTATFRSSLADCLGLEKHLNDISSSSSAADFDSPANDVYSITRDNVCHVDIPKTQKCVVERMHDGGCVTEHGAMLIAADVTSDEAIVASAIKAYCDVIKMASRVFQEPSNTTAYDDDDLDMLNLASHLEVSVPTTDGRRLSSDVFESSVDTFVNNLLPPNAQAVRVDPSSDESADDVVRHKYTIVPKHHHDGGPLRRVAAADSTTTSSTPPLWSGVPSPSSIHGLASYIGPVQYAMTPEQTLSGLAVALGNPDSPFYTSDVFGKVLCPDGTKSCALVYPSMKLSPTTSSSTALPTTSATKSSGAVGWANVSFCMAAMIVFLSVFV